MPDKDKTFSSSLLLDLEFDDVTCKLCFVFLSIFLYSLFDSRTCSLKPRPNGRNMPTQHVATLLGATSFETSQTWANNTQHVATHRNTVAKRPTMLRYVVLACCDRLAGALVRSVINPELLNAHAHDAKHVLSFATLRKYRDPSDPSRSLIILPVPPPMYLLHNLHSLHPRNREMTKRPIPVTRLWDRERQQKRI